MNFFTLMEYFQHGRKMGGGNLRYTNTGRKINNTRSIEKNEYLLEEVNMGE